MKQNLTVIGIAAFCSLLFIILMWAPFTSPLTINQVIKYAAIGAILGLVFYYVGLRKTVKKKKARR
jgi:hypothetical protein